MSYSNDLRIRVVAAVFSGETRRGAAVRFSIRPSTAIRWAGRACEEGEAKARKPGRPQGKGPLAAHRGFLVAAVDAKPDITMPQLAARLLETHGVKAHPASISRLLCRAGFSYKKTADGLGVRTGGRCRETTGLDGQAPARDAPAAGPAGVHR